MKSIFLLESLAVGENVLALDPVRKRISNMERVFRFSTSQLFTSSSDFVKTATDLATRYVNHINPKSASRF
jgi:hypothetical protein